GARRSKEPERRARETVERVVGAISHAIRTVGQSLRNFVEPHHEEPAIYADPEVSRSIFYDRPNAILRETLCRAERYEPTIGKSSEAAAPPDPDDAVFTFEPCVQGLVYPLIEALPLIHHAKGAVGLNHSQAPAREPDPQTVMRVGAGKYDLAELYRLRRVVEFGQLRAGPSKQTSAVPQPEPSVAV